MKKETVGQGFRVPGFTTAGIFCGIKTNKQKDLALIFSEEPSVAAGVFTLNKVVSPTITWCQQNIKSSKIIKESYVATCDTEICNYSTLLF